MDTESLKNFALTLLIIFATLNSCSQQEAIIFPEGGYAFPEKINPRDSDFYAYPLIDSFSRVDSFANAYFGKYFYKFFEEKNISLRAEDKPLVRFLFEEGGNSGIIILIEDSLIIKTKEGQIYPAEKDSLLSESERGHFYFLQRGFPLEERRLNSAESAHVIDSMTNRYPQLLDAKYYMSLKEKMAVPFEGKYETKKIAITEKQFNDLIQQLNASGYWKMPYRVNCKTPAMDAAGYGLEINTGKKYNSVSFEICPETPKEFTKTIKNILTLADIKH